MENPRFTKGGPVAGFQMIAPGEIISTPERAEQLGLTADARRMRRQQHIISTETNRADDGSCGWVGEWRSEVGPRIASRERGVEEGAGDGPEADHAVS